MALSLKNMVILVSIGTPLRGFLTAEQEALSGLFVTRKDVDP